MIPLKELHYQAKWMEMNFSTKQLSDLYSTIDTDSFHTYAEVEDYYADLPNFTVTYHRSLSKLVDSLSHLKGAEEVAIEFMHSEHGQVIDLIYIPYNEMYALASGHR